MDSPAAESAAVSGIQISCLQVLNCLYVPACLLHLNARRNHGHSPEVVEIKYNVMCKNSSANKMIFVQNTFAANSEMMFIVPQQPAIQAEFSTSD